MKYVARMAPLILGDVVITSGMGNLYPKGLFVGKISRIERESYGTTQKIEIRPTVDFSRLEDVIVLVDDDRALRERELKVLNSLEYGGM